MAFKAPETARILTNADKTDSDAEKQISTLIKPPRARATKSQLEARWGFVPGAPTAPRINGAPPVIEVAAMGQREKWVMVGCDGKNEMYELEAKWRF